MATGVVVTRDEGPDGPLSRLLRRPRLTVHHWPVIRTAPPADPAPLEDALRELRRYDWVVFTSPRGVAAVTGRVGAPEVTDGPDRPRAAAVGESTADALREAGWTVAVVPPTQTAAALVTALRAAGLGSGDRVLFPASAIARGTVPDGLEETGAVVVQVEAYRTLPAALDRQECLEALARGCIQLVTFTSPSSVQNLVAALGADGAARTMAAVRAVAIGPTTAAAAEEAGFEVAAVAEPHSLEGLAQRVAELAARERNGGGTK